MQLRRRGRNLFIDGIYYSPYRAFFRPILESDQNYIQPVPENVMGYLADRRRRYLLFRRP